MSSTFYYLTVGAIIGAVVVYFDPDWKYKILIGVSLGITAGILKAALF
ncbi:MAG: hypothetical protein ACOCQE_01870 [Halanaerobium sp.]